MLIRGNKGFAVSDPLGRIKYFNKGSEQILPKAICEPLGRIKKIKNATY